MQPVNRAAGIVNADDSQLVLRRRTFGCVGKADRNELAAFSSDRQQLIRDAAQRLTDQVEPIFKSLKH